MGTIYTEEQRERLQRHIVDLVRKNGRMTMPQLASATYASHDSIRRYQRLNHSMQSGMLFVKLWQNLNVKRKTPKPGYEQPGQQYCMRKMTLKILSRR